MKLIPLGGGREIGANCFYMELGNSRIILDAGRHPTKDGYDSLPELDAIDHVDAVVISHSHYDHVSSLPCVVQRWPGVRVITSADNKQTALRILHNSVEVMKKRNEKDSEPVLYNHGEINALKKTIEDIEYGDTVFLGKDLRLELFPAGHVMGASSALLSLNGNRVFYTGDISLSNQFTVPHASLPENSDVVISEGTYGMSEQSVSTRYEELKRLIDLISATVDSGGRVLLPVFALGRGQEAIYMVLKAIEEERLPRVPVYINGMISALTGIYLQTYLRADQKTRSWLASAMNRYTTVLPKNIDRVLLSRKPAIMILSSGMLVEETLSYVFASHMVKSERDSIIFMGYQSPDSPGFHLLKAFKEGEETFLFDQEEVELRCRAIENMNFSGHATYEELLSIPRQLGSSRLVLVHGDSNALENIAHEVMYEFDVDIPSNLEEVVF